MGLTNTSKILFGLVAAAMLGAALYMAMDDLKVGAPASPPPAVTETVE
ncbi:MAG: hypothetical protein HQL52_18890 [Magnetococcales bacterium]|nr:hypothetical protein [Magnetococcales bacterium]